MNIYYDFGKEIIGPFIYGFILWLKKAIKADNREGGRLFFLARDGFVLEKMYNIVYPEDETNYLYLSRNSVRRALLWKYPEFVDSLRFLTNSYYVPFSEISVYYGVKRETYDSQKEVIGIGWNQDLKFSELKDNESLRMFYELNKSEILKESEVQYNLLVSYLKNADFRGVCNVVDTGWHGTIQHYLTILFDLDVASSDVDVNGYYIGVAPRSDMKLCVNGYMYEKENDSNRKKILSFFGVIEKFLQSFEGSTKGYFLKGKDVVSFSETYEYEDDDNIVAKLRDVQSGIECYVRGVVSGELKFDESESKDNFLRFGMNPTSDEVNMFKFLYNTDGCKSYFVSQKGLFEYESVKEFVHALRNSCWKTGFFKSVFRMPFPYYFLYCLCRK